MRVSISVIKSTQHPLQKSQIYETQTCSFFRVNHDARPVFMHCLYRPEWSSVWCRFPAGRSRSQDSIWLCDEFPWPSSELSELAAGVWSPQRLRRTRLHSATSTMQSLTSRGTLAVSMELPRFTLHPPRMCRSRWTIWPTGCLLLMKQNQNP